MSDRHIFTTEKAIYVGTLKETTTEIIHVAMIDMIGPLPARVVETEVVTGWLLEDAWLLQGERDVRFVYQDLSVHGPNMQRTKITEDIWINRDQVVSYTVLSDAGGDWGTT